MQRPGRRDLAHAALGGVALAGVCLWLTASPGSVVSNDALDYAQMGRELARGHGASTLQIFPRHIPFLHDNGLLDGRWPNLHRYPLPTWLDAVAAVFTDDPRRAAFYQSAVSYLAQVTVFAVFARWLAPLGMALVVTAFFAADPVVLSGASKGLSEGLGMLWVLVVLLTCARPQGMRSRDAVVAGVACGFAWLTRTQLAVLLPAVVIVSGLRVGWRAAAASVMGAALPVLPVAARLWMLTGDPLFSFSTARNLALRAAPSDIDMVLDAPVHTADVVAAHREAISKKVWKNLSRITSPDKMHAVWDELSAWALLATAIAAAIAARTHRALIGLSVWMVLASFVAISVAFHSSRFYDPVRPLPYLLLLAGVAVVWERTPSRPRAARRAVAAAAMFGSLALLAPTIEQGPLATRRIRTLRPDRLAQLDALLPEDAVVVSDVSVKTALYTGRRSIRLPIDPDDLLTIDSDYIRVDAVVLSEKVFKDERRTRSLFANYWRYSEAVGSDAFTERWEGPIEGPAKTTVYLRRAP